MFSRIEVTTPPPACGAIDVKALHFVHQTASVALVKEPASRTKANFIRLAAGLGESCPMHGIDADEIHTQVVGWNPPQSALKYLSSKSSACKAPGPA